MIDVAKGPHLASRLRWLCNQFEAPFQLIYQLHVQCQSQFFCSPLTLLNQTRIQRKHDKFAFSIESRWFLTLRPFPLVNSASWELQLENFIASSAWAELRKKWKVTQMISLRLIMWYQILVRIGSSQCVIRCNFLSSNGQKTVCGSKKSKAKKQKNWERKRETKRDAMRLWVESRTLACFSASLLIALLFAKKE